MSIIPLTLPSKVCKCENKERVTRQNHLQASKKGSKGHFLLVTGCILKLLIIGRQMPQAGREEMLPALSIVMLLKCKVCCIIVVVHFTAQILELSVVTIFSLKADKNVQILLIDKFNSLKRSHIFHPSHK